MKDPLPGLRLGFLAVMVPALAAAAFASYPSSDPDVYFHLAVGREIVESGSLPATEPFCTISQGRPFVNHEWLFDVAAWLAFDTMGPAGVGMLKAALAALLFGLVALLAVRMGAGPFLAAMACIAFLPLFRESLEARPHLAAYAIAAGFLLGLDGLAEGGRANLVVLPLLAALWANVHGSFILVPVLWAIRAAPVLLDRESRGHAGHPMLLALALSTAATLANPWGPGLFGVVFHHLEPAYREMVPEWKPIQWGEEPARDALYLALVAGALLSFVPRINRRRVADLALLTTFLVPAAVSSKFHVGLAVGAVPVLAANLTRAGFVSTAARRWTAVALAAACLALAPFVSPASAPGLGLDERDQPADALAFAAGHAVSGKLFNPFNAGGYCEFAAWPGLAPFIDGRAYVHGMDGIREYLGALADYGVFKALDGRHGFDAVLVDFLDGSFPRLAGGLSRDPAFAMVHIDSRFALFVPAAMAGGAMPPFRFARPTSDPRWVFSAADAELPAIRAEVERVLAVPSGETLGLLLRGCLGLREAGLGPSPEEASREPRAQAPCVEAERDFARLVELRADVPMFRRLHSLALACLGHDHQSGDGQASQTR